MADSEQVAARVDAWMSALEARHMSDLTFQEVSRSLRALSSTYVERRATLSKGGALSGAGKRAAFALFYAPLHFLLVRRIVEALGEPFTEIDTLLDLGCGTGAAGAGWATACRRTPRVLGIDRHPWAVDETRRTLQDLGVAGSARIDDLTREPIAGLQRAAAGGATARASRKGQAVLLAFAVNEIDDAQRRDALRDRLLVHADAGGPVIVVEPLAGFVAPWWSSWQSAFEARGGRADEWRFDAALPPLVQKLAHASGLNHRELKARTLSS
jgi:hypothetical protein